MAIDDYVSFSEFLGVNKDTMAEIKKAMEAERMRQQSESDAATAGLKKQAVDSAYWGGSGDIGTYSDYTSAVEKADAAEMFRKNITNDAGQAEEMRKKYGAATGMDALLFGDPSESDLGKFLGNKGIEQAGADTTAARKDYDSELKAQQDSWKQMEDWNRQSNQWNDARGKYLDEARQSLLDSYRKQPGKWLDKGYYEYLNGGQDPSGEYAKRAEQEYSSGGNAGFEAWAGTQGIMNPGGKPVGYKGRLRNSAFDTFNLGPTASALGMFGGK